MEDLWKIIVQSKIKLGKIFVQKCRADNFQYKNRYININMK